MRRLLLLITLTILLCTNVYAAKELKQYYFDGTLKSVATYNNKKKLDGVYKNYWPNGILKEQGRYKDGVLIGPVIRYAQDGTRLTP